MDTAELAICRSEHEKAAARASVARVAKAQRGFRSLAQKAQVGATDLMVRAHDGTWFACRSDDGVIVAGGFATHADAWAWIDANTSTALERRLDRARAFFRNL